MLWESRNTKFVKLILPERKKVGEIGLHVLSSCFLSSDAFISWNSRRRCRSRIAVIRMVLLIGGRRGLSGSAWSPSHVLNKKWICANCNSKTSERWKHHWQNCIYIKLHKNLYDKMSDLRDKTIVVRKEKICKTYYASQWKWGNFFTTV